MDTQYKHESSSLQEKVKNLSSDDSWQKFIENSTVVETIRTDLDGGIKYLEKCAYKLRKGDLFKEKIGMVDNQTWKDFQVLVIKNLKEDGYFNKTQDKTVFDYKFGKSEDDSYAIINVAYDRMEKILK
jgi:hypothetical protein